MRACYETRRIAIRSATAEHHETGYLMGMGGGEVDALYLTVVC